MEKFLKPYDKEYMKLAMLKHEETFKEQVHELHRLYRIQKILMKNIGNTNSHNNNTLQNTQDLWKAKNNINFTRKSIIKLDLERPAEEYEYGMDLELIDESQIELTLGPSSYSNRTRRRRRKKPDTDTPLTSDSGPSFSSSSTGSSHINKSSSHHAKKEKSDFKLGLPDDTATRVDEQLRQERLKQPPWLYQVLSLNMT